MYAKALEKILPRGKFPEDTMEYLEWDDCKVMNLMKEKRDTIEECASIINRIVYPRILRSETHPNKSDKRFFNLLKKTLYDEIGKEHFIEDDSAYKMPHKIPTKTEISDEKAIIIVNKSNNKKSTISEESHIIKMLTEKIDIVRVYVKPEYKNKASELIDEIYEKID